MYFIPDMGQNIKQLITNLIYCSSHWSEGRPVGQVGCVLLNHLYQEVSRTMCNVFYTTM